MELAPSRVRKVLTEQDWDVTEASRVLSLDEAELITFLSSVTYRNYTTACAAVDYARLQELARNEAIRNISVLCEIRDGASRDADRVAAVKALHSILETYMPSAPTQPEAVSNESRDDKIVRILEVLAVSNSASSGTA